MPRIALLSDTHGYLDDGILRALDATDEVWHAGDFGPGVAARLRALGKPVLGVWGNIDDAADRADFPERAVFSCEGLHVFMQHIGGYPGRYAPGVKAALTEARPGLFISGHSHILKVMPDNALGLLHMNPGACGQQGWHTVRTLLRFSITDGKVHSAEVVELGKRGRV